MKVKALIAAMALAGLLVALNHITFGQSEEIPAVPITNETVAEVVAEATGDPSMESTGETVELVNRPDTGEGGEITETEGDQDLITISLDNAPLADVVRMFSRISGANIVAGTNLQGSVTVSMHDVPWEPALGAILDSVSLVLVEKQNGIFSIISKSELAAEPVQIETVFLNFTQVSNVAPVVQQMIVSTNGSVSTFPSANAMVIQETASRLSAIRGVIKKIDKPRPQVYIEAKFIELNETAIENIGVNWEVLKDFSFGVLPSASYTEQRVGDDNFLDTFGLRDNNRRTRSSTQTSDRDTDSNRTLFDADGQLFTSEGDFSVALSGRNAIPSITRETDALGRETVTTDLAVQGPTRGTTSTTSRNTLSENFSELESTFSRVNTFQNQDTATRLLSAVLTSEELAVTLSALNEQDGVQVVSNPKVIVSNGETAFIHVGRNEPDVTAVPQGDTGDRFAVALDQTNPYIEIGVKLQVTPTVNTEDNITIKIVPELSRKLGDLTVGSVGVSYPITSIRKIETEFQVPSGKTVAIGGLTETSDEESIKKIPVLGDIPVIGKYLFSHRSTQKVQDEVIIFVTVGMASPKTLVEIAGIPEEGDLIHRHLANKAAESAVEMVEE